MPTYQGPNNIGGINPAGFGSSLATGGGGGFLNGISGFANGVGNFLGSQGGQGLLGLAGMGANLYGLNKSLGFQEDQLGVLKDQEARAADAQRLNTGNMLSLALQTTTPGTPEHERVKAEIAQGGGQA
jgi:hypothetical protein